MRRHVRDALLKVFEEWHKPLQQIEIKVMGVEGSAMTEDEVIALVRGVMLEASCDAFVQLKLAHVAAMDTG